MFQSVLGTQDFCKAAVDILYEHRVITDVIKSQFFKPWGMFAVEYYPGAPVAMGNDMPPSMTSKKPRFSFTADPNGRSPSVSDSDLFTVVMTDPDAPSSTDRKWSEFCHYVVSDLEVYDDTTRYQNPEDTGEAATRPSYLSVELVRGNVLVDYMGPAPPEDTGKHRYVFLLYKQYRDSSTYTRVSDRTNWGYGTPGMGADQWARENNLELIGANFFYASSVSKKVTVI